MLGVSAFALVIVAFFDSPSAFGICFPYTNSRGTTCVAPYAQLANVLGPLAYAFLISTLVALLSHKNTFRRWVKFSIWYGAIITLLLFAIPELGYGLGGFGLTLINTQGFAVLYAILYAIISLILLGLSELKERRKGT